jgi:hypothetical protein
MRFLGFTAAVLKRSKEWEVVLFFFSFCVCVCSVWDGYWKLPRNRYPEGIMTVLRIHSCSYETIKRMGWGGFWHIYIITVLNFLNFFK